MAEQSYEQVALFRDLTAEDLGDLETTTIESLCMNCHEQGTTRLLLTRIPFFREIVISSFSCESCHFSNNEVQSAGRIQDKGCRISVQIQTKEDFNRQVVKSDTASVKIPSLDFEIPGSSQKGVFTTVEGIITRAIEGLQQEQPVRKALHPELAEQIDGFIGKLQNLEPPFQLIVDDPAGNSFVENPKAPEADPAMSVTMYSRSDEQNSTLGLQVEEDSTTASPPAEVDAAKEPPEAEDDLSELPEEVMQFNVSCCSCGAPTTTKMKLVSIPYFKDIVLMSTNCESCGYRDAEVKSGVGVEAKGRRITLKMTDAAMDLNRDVLKTDMCQFLIPELNFELMMGTLGGKFTTLEGLLCDIRDQLQRPYAHITSGDSAPKGAGSKLKEFIDKIDKIVAGETLVTVVLDDPSGNSYIQNVYAPDVDPELLVEEYERTEQQDDDLGILQMKTENYDEEDN